MEIKIVMRSQLEAHLKPDFELIKNALANIESLHECKNEAALNLFKMQVSSLEMLIAQQQQLSADLKAETDPEKKSEMQDNKKYITKVIDSMLEKSLSSLAQAGGGDLYHYNYDLHFNRVVAGLMGSTCYMKDTFADLQQKGIKNILAIASTVETNGHHSTFGHSHLTLEITGIPKALAMVINNEKEYCTSEKSARYTIMNEIEPTQSALFEKWREILAREIGAKYGDARPFFDEKGVKVTKLAQENARYMISVFTPTNMVYTTSFRQLNYLAHWLEEAANNPPNEFYKQVKPQMQEFVQFVKDNNLYSPLIEDHKDRKLSLFGEGILKDVLTSSVYALGYHASFACLAQLQRHRTIHYNIDEFDFVHAPKKFYTPPILAGNPDLVAQWEEDIESVEDCYPQGMLVPIIEKGETSDFLLKAKERVCVCAQKEIRDLTSSTCLRFAHALQDDSRTALFESLSNSHKASIWLGGIKESEELRYQAVAKQQISDQLEKKAEEFEKLSRGARCTAGYKCASPCKFPDGVSLNSEV